MVSKAVSKGISVRILSFMAAGLLFLSGPSFATTGVLQPPPTNGGTATPSPTSNTNENVLYDPVCDPHVFSAMKAKATAEAQRENYVNQSIILKPDSLFALTCFDKQVGQTMGKLGVSEDPNNSSNTQPFQNNVKSTSGSLYPAFMGPLDSNGKPLYNPNINTTTTSNYSGYNAQIRAI